MMTKPGHIVTPPCRLSFPALFEPRPVAKNSDEKKFMATLLLPASCDLKPFIDAMKSAAIEKWAKVPKFPARNNPLKSCEEKELDGYEDGWHFVNAKSNRQPQVVDQKVKPILDPSLIYPGCWVRAAINAYAWDHELGGKGISFGLNAIQFYKDGERLDGRVDVEDVFDVMEVEDDEAVFGDEGETDDADALFG